MNLAVANTPRNRRGERRKTVYPGKQGEESRLLKPRSIPRVLRENSSFPDVGKSARSGALRRVPTTRQTSCTLEGKSRQSLAGVPTERETVGREKKEKSVEDGGREREREVEKEENNREHLTAGVVAQEARTRDRGRRR